MRLAGAAWPVVRHARGYRGLPFSPSVFLLPFRQVGRMWRVRAGGGGGGAAALPSPIKGRARRGQDVILLPAGDPGTSRARETMAPTNVSYRHIDAHFHFADYGDLHLVTEKVSDYANATLLCDQHGKKLDTWLRFPRTKKLLECFLLQYVPSLSSSSESAAAAATTSSQLDQAVAHMRASDVATVHLDLKKDPNAHLINGTYLHLLLLPHLAQWISPELAIDATHLVVYGNRYVRHLNEKNLALEHGNRLLRVEMDAFAEASRRPTDDDDRFKFQLDVIKNMFTKREEKEDDQEAAEKDASKEEAKDQLLRPPPSLASSPQPQPASLLRLNTPFEVVRQTAALEEGANPRLSTVLEEATHRQLETLLRNMADIKGQIQTHHAADAEDAADRLSRMRSLEEANRQLETRVATVEEVNRQLDTRMKYLEGLIGISVSASSSTQDLCDDDETHAAAAGGAKPPLEHAVVLVRLTDQEKDYCAIRGRRADLPRKLEQLKETFPDHEEMLRLDYEPHPLDAMAQESSDHPDSPRDRIYFTTDMSLAELGRLLYDVQRVQVDEVD